MPRRRIATPSLNERLYTPRSLRASTPSAPPPAPARALLAWYVLARALKPGPVVETGIYKGPRLARAAAGARVQPQRGQPG